MRVLIVSPEIPIPLNNGGKLRVYHLLKSLVQQGHEVTFVVYGDGTTSPHCNWFGEDRVFNLVQVTKPVKLLRIFDFICAVFRGVPYQYAYYSTRNMRKTISNLLFCGYDICMVEYLAMLDNLHFGKENYLRVIDTHNVEYRRVQQQETGYFFLHKFYSFYVKHYEKKQLNNVDTILACSDADAEYFKSNQINTPILVVPNGVDTNYYSSFRLNREYQSKRLIFIGSLDYWPNIEGLDWFVNEIWPKLLEMEPQVEFHIIGRNPGNDVIRLGTKPNVTIYGNVPDVREHLCIATIVVVPLKSGSGTRLKILEAMAAGKAIVSTSIGAEGIDYTDNFNIVIADSVKSFLNSIINLLNDQERRTKIEIKAKDLAERKYEWNKIGIYLSSSLYSLIKR